MFCDVSLCICIQRLNSGIHDDLHLRELAMCSGVFRHMVAHIFSIRSTRTRTGIQYDLHLRVLATRSGVFRRMLASLLSQEYSIHDIGRLRSLVAHVDVSDCCMSNYPCQAPFGTGRTTIDLSSKKSSVPVLFFGGAGWALCLDSSARLGTPGNLLLIWLARLAVRRAAG